MKVYISFKPLVSNINLHPYDVGPGPTKHTVVALHGLLSSCVMWLLPEPIPARWRCRLNTSG